MPGIRLLPALIIVCGLICAPAEATTRLIPLTRIDNPQAISDPNAAIDSRFGAAVAVSGNVVLVGVPRHDAGGLDDRGQVRIFQRAGDTWDAVGSVEGATAGANFGASLAVSGEIVVVGAPGANEARVYRLVGSTLTQVTSLTGAGGDVAIGLAVAATPGSVFAGGANALAYKNGSGTTWGTQFSISPSDPARAAFGASLSVANGQLLVGDPGQGFGVGAVYTGALSGGAWAVSNKFSEPSARRFGEAVAWRAPNLAVTGAPASAVGALIDAGNVRVRSTAGGGSELQSLSASPPLAGESFGAALAVAGPILLVGAINDVPAPTSSGSVHVFRCQASGLNPCVGGQRVQAAGGAPGDRFGAAIATDGILAVVGAPRFDPAGSTDAGSIFIYGVDDENLYANGFEEPLQ